EPEPIPLAIVYEDSSLIVLCKQAGLCVHPAAGNDRGTLVNALLHHTRDLSGINGLLRPGIVHRLDKTTSGIMVVAKNDKAHRKLARQFQDRTIKKEYLAVVQGTMVPKAGRISYSIGRDKHNRKKMTVTPQGGREAETIFSIEERFTGFDVVRLFPVQGRTHQIRVHLAHYGHPVLGDEMYGRTSKIIESYPALKTAILNLSGNALHAHKISFDHPESGERVQFEAEIPPDFENLLTVLRTFFTEKKRDT
ncbi:RluA family pseudouridine synthase, partial [candidate division CSSED10-310 bacterium]